MLKSTVKKNDSVKSLRGHYRRLVQGTTEQISYTTACSENRPKCVEFNHIERHIRIWTTAQIQLMAGCWIKDRKTIYVSCRYLHIINPQSKRKTLKTKICVQRWDSNASHQSDAHKLRRPSLQCRLTACLQPSADGPQTAGLVIQMFQIVAEDVFIWSMKPKRSVNPPPIKLRSRNHLTYLTCTR